MQKVKKAKKLKKVIKVRDEMRRFLDRAVSMAGVHSQDNREGLHLVIINSLLFFLFFFWGGGDT